MIRVAVITVSDRSSRGEREDLSGPALAEAAAALPASVVRREIVPDERPEIAAAIRRAAEEADVVLLLVSADFLASDYCYDIEMTRAMERHEAGEARVVPMDSFRPFFTGEHPQLDLILIAACFSQEIIKRLLGNNGVRHDVGMGAAIDSLPLFFAAYEHGRCT